MVDTKVIVQGGSGGGQFTSSEKISGGTGSRFGQAIEPFLAFRTRYDQALEQLRAAPGAEETAILCWGGTPRDPLKGATTSFKTRGASEQPVPDKDDPDKRIILRERERWVEKVEIKSDDDPDVALTTERIRLWIANGNDGKTYYLECKPDGKKTVMTKGATIPAEAFA